MEDYKKLITENWKWAVFHNEIVAPLFMKVALAAGVVLLVCLYFMVTRENVHFDYKKREPAVQADYSDAVLKFFNAPIEPVTMTAEEFTEKYYSDADLPKLEETIINDLNTTGKISVEHVEIAPGEYAKNAQNPAFMRVNMSPDIAVFSVIIFSPQTHRIDRFIAVARKLDKWRLIVIKTPAPSKNLQSLSSFKDTSAKIHSAIAQ